MWHVQPVYALRTVIILTASMLAAPGFAGENRFVFVPQADFPGNDLLKLDNSSFEDCKRRCDAQSDCNAFTYNQRYSVCFLKYAANRLTNFYAFAITGIRLSPSMLPTAGASRSGGSSFVLISQADSVGNDYSRIDHFSFEECRSSCAADDGCNAFTYNHARGVCFLKDAPNQWTTFYAWATTGIKLSSPKEERTNAERPQPQVTAPSEVYATGTGFLVSNDGLVLTNRHVVEKCEDLTIHGRGPAIIKEIDPTNDLALLKMQGSTIPATFRSTSSDLGDAVYALGFPYSGVLGSGVNFTGGLVSSLSGIGNDSRYLQFTAPVQPGNSGGPLVDVNGLIVGVVSARLDDIEVLKASGSLPQNVNFAIRGHLATDFLRANGVVPVIAEPKSPLSASAIASNAQGYTVQVVCQPTP
jgi:S1-C subfamily serine protease